MLGAVTRFSTPTPWHSSSGILSLNQKRCWPDRHGNILKSPSKPARPERRHSRRQSQRRQPTPLLSSRVQQHLEQTQHLVGIDRLADDPQIRVLRNLAHYG